MDDDYPMDNPVDDYPELDPDDWYNGNGTPQGLDAASESETIPGFSPLPQDRANDFPKLVLAELAATYECQEQPIAQTGVPPKPHSPEKARPSMEELRKAPC